MRPCSNVLFGWAAVAAVLQRAAVAVIAAAKAKAHTAVSVNG